MPVPAKAQLKDSATEQRGIRRLPSRAKLKATSNLSPVDPENKSNERVPARLEVSVIRKTERATSSKLTTENATRIRPVSSINIASTTTRKTGLPLPRTIPITSASNAAVDSGDVGSEKVNVKMMPSRTAGTTSSTAATTATRAPSSTILNFSNTTDTRDLAASKISSASQRPASKTIFTSTSKLKTPTTLSRPTPTLHKTVTKTSTTLHSIPRPTKPVTRIRPSSRPLSSSSSSQPATAPTSTSTKTPFSSTSTAPAPPSSSSLVNRLRAELYQLQLLHNASSDTLQQYTTSISQNLSKRKTHLSALQRQVIDLENRQQKALSTIALSSWLEPDRNHAIVANNNVNHTTDPTTESRQRRKIQDLSSTIRTLDSFFSNESDETLRPLETFQVWLEEALPIRQKRNHKHFVSLAPLMSMVKDDKVQIDNNVVLEDAEVDREENYNEEFKLIRPLPDTWRRQMRDLQHLLRDIHTTLRDIDSDRASYGGSVQREHDRASDNKDNFAIDDRNSAKAGLDVVLSKHMKLVTCLMQEVQMAEEVERAIVKEEKGWRETEVARILEDLGVQDEDAGDEDEEEMEKKRDEYRPAWRS